MNVTCGGTNATLLGVSCPNPPYAVKDEKGADDRARITILRNGLWQKRHDDSSLPWKKHVETSEHAGRGSPREYSRDPMASWL